MDKKLKIAIIGSRGYPYVYSGYETLVKELSERLVKRGHNVRVYCHSSLFSKKPKFVNGIELVYTPSIETKFLSQFINSFFSFIHVCFSNVDVVFVVNSANGTFGILTKIIGIKTCINVDGLEWMRPKWRGLGSIYFKFSSKLATLFYDEIVTDSNEMNKVYEEKFKKKSTVIAYGPSMIKNYNKLILEKYKLTQKNYYLVVGRLIPDNNSKLIIQGFLNSRSNKKLVIVGDVPYKDSYADSVKSLSAKNIIFTGYISNSNDLTCLYDSCYCYIHGHEFGGTNPTMINALHLNRQIIALNTKFNKEMLENKEAVLFEKNLKSISESIQIIEKKYIEIYNKNLEYKIEKKYNWNNVTDSYLKIFYKTTNYQNM